MIIDITCGTLNLLSVSAAYFEDLETSSEK